MKIDLEYPYSEKWRSGYLVINKEPRRNVVLFNSSKDRTTVSYARYLMSVSIGRFLSDDEVVDHINNDKLYDRLDNYQIISRAENNRKSKKPARIEIRTCPVCMRDFEFESRNASTRKDPTCSRSCGAKKSRFKS